MGPQYVSDFDILVSSNKGPRCVSDSEYFGELHWAQNMFQILISWRAPIGVQDVFQIQNILESSIGPKIFFRFLILWRAPLRPKFISDFDILESSNKGPRCVSDSDYFGELHWAQNIFQILISWRSPIRAQDVFQILNILDCSIGPKTYFRF